MVCTQAWVWATVVSEDLDINGLYREHGRFLARCIGRLVGPGEHVQDVLHETFIVAFKRQRSFDPARASARSWLYGIARNYCRSHLRASRRRIKLEDRVQCEPQAHRERQPDEAADAALALKAVTDVLILLPEKHQEVFVLYELEEMEGPEIAELLGIPVGTVWTRLHHARKGFEKQMRRRLAREGQPS